MSQIIIMDFFLQFLKLKDELTLILVALSKAQLSSVLREAAKRVI